MSPTTSRWLFIGLFALVIWRLLPLSTEQEMAAANRAWRTGHFDEATRIWSPLADQGQPRAQALMGWSHEVGQGSEQDIHQAISLYRQSAQAGDPFGQYRLAELYLRGVGVKRDLRQAFHWMEQAARNGDVPAMLKVGVLHLMGSAAGSIWLRRNSGSIRRHKRATSWRFRCCKSWRWQRRGAVTLTSTGNPCLANSR